MAKFEKKYTLGQVQEIFRQGGCELLQDSYDYTNTPLKYRCQCGIESKIRLSAFIGGSRCRACGGKKISQKRTLSIDTVKAKFEEHNYTLISTEYQGAHQKLSVICPVGHNIQISYGNFNHGTRCRHCFFDGQRKTKPPLLRPTPMKHTFESVKGHLASEGFDLLSKEYKTSSHKLDCVCPKGHQIQIRYSSFRRGARCTECGKEKRRGCGNWRWQSDREELKKNQKYSQVCRTMVRRTLKATNEAKERKTEQYLGYNADELKMHFENHPNMKVIGKEKWVPDHIFPIKAFLDYGVTDISIINGLDNLQPLTEQDNHRKSDKYDPSEFKHFLKSKGVL